MVEEASEIVGDGRPTLIERTEQFDKAKRNFVWFSAALGLTAFATDPTGNAQPLLGISLKPEWLALGLLLATLYTVYPFAYFWLRERSLNARHGADNVRDLAKVAGELHQGWSAALVQLRNLENEARMWSEQLQASGEKKVNWEAAGLRDIIAVTLDMSWIDEAEDRADQLVELIEQIRASANFDSDFPDGYRHMVVQKLASLPPGTMDRVGDAVAQDFERRGLESMNGQIAQFLNPLTSQTERLTRKPAQFEGNISELAKRAKELGKLKENLFRGERVMHVWLDMVIPAAIAIGAIGLALTAYGEDWWEAYQEPRCYLPIFDRSACLAPQTPEVGASA